jgi:hypothetical protein
MASVALTTNCPALMPFRHSTAADESLRSQAGKGVGLLSYQKVHKAASELQAGATLPGCSLLVQRLSSSKLFTSTDLIASRDIFTPQLARRHTKNATTIHAMSSEAASATTYHVLPSGQQLEVIERKAKKSAGAPVVFVHGSSHAAWCWEEHWLDYFAGNGHDAYAISLLGQVRGVSIQDLSGVQIWDGWKLYHHCL